MLLAKGRGSKNRTMLWTPYMEAPLPHLPSQLDVVHQVAHAERVPHQHGEVLGQRAVALGKRPRHTDGQSDVILTVGLPHNSELLFSGVVRFHGSNFYPPPWPSMCFKLC